MDDSGNLYIADHGNYRIRKVNLASGIISTVAGNGSATYSGGGVPATATGIQYPTTLAVDSSGNLYTTIPVAVNASVVAKITTTDTIVTIAGNSTGGYTGDHCAATAAGFTEMQGLCTDRFGNIYTSFILSNYVRKMSRDAVPWFVGGHSQYITLCYGAGADSINTLLAMLDSDARQWETWSAVVSPAHGSLSASFSDTSTGGLLTPSGLYYSPASGYTGTDSFQVAVIDCGGASDTTTIHVNVVPSFSSVTLSGGTAICAGASAAVSASLGGGAWSSLNTAVATVGSASGIVGGAAAGTATISYSLSLSCGSASAAVVVTVNPNPAAITGLASLCAASGITLSDSTAGGTWSSSSSSAAATIGSSGAVSGVSGGTPVISYTLGTGCYATKLITVNPLPATITGTLSVCVSATTALGDGSAGGTWSAAPTAIASVGTLSGVVTGVAAGTSSNTYTLGTGCLRSAVVTVNALPAAITGAGTVCTGATASLSDSTGGGAWSSSAGSGGATVGSASGTVYGVSTGTANVTYALTTGCNATRVVTVYTTPTPITGAATLCTGAATFLTDGVSGGTWGSSNTAVATVVPASGLVSGVSTGVATITYNTGGSCQATFSITVLPLPSVITGAMNVCPTATTLLHDSTSSGVWSSGYTSIATVGSASGLVTGVGAGITPLTYTLGTGCYATANVTVNPAPAIISGTPYMCPGEVAYFTDATPGGTWSSSNTAIATTILSPGMVTAVAAGSAAIIYTLGGTGCSAGYSFIVNPGPSAIGGSTGICAGYTDTLSDAAGGGSWSSSAPAIATVDATGGGVTGLSTGTAIVTYTLSSGCTATKTITVNTAPGAISGPGTIVAGTTALLSSSPAGGTWSSSNTIVASINAASGTVTGVAAGTAMISYGLGGCESSAMIVVAPALSVTTTPCGLSEITTVAGSGPGGYGSGGFGGDTGPATVAQLNLPNGVANDPFGNFFISDSYNNRIRKVNAAGMITTYAGTGTLGSDGDGGPATAAKITLEFGIAADAAGNVYIPDANFKVRKINTAGIITTVAGNGLPSGVLGDGGPATAAFIQPEAVAVDASGNIYISDFTHYRIRKVSTAGIITTIAGTGTGGFTGDGGPATNAQINTNTGLAVDGAGNIYFADQATSRIRKIDGSGTITTIAGTGISGSTGDGGTALSAELAGSAGLATDAYGNLYLADGNRIREISTSGIITAVAGTGALGYSGDGGPATAATFVGANAVSADAAGNVYIADLENYRVRKVNLENNHAPEFTGGHAQNLALCEDAGATAINTLLAVVDSDAGQTENWSILLSPVHGSIVATFTATSTGGVLAPAGLSYTPATGYAGSDSFRIKVTDCYGTYDTTTIRIAITPLPVAGTIAGNGAHVYGGDGNTHRQRCGRRMEPRNRRDRYCVAHRHCDWYIGRHGYNFVQGHQWLRHGGGDESGYGKSNTRHKRALGSMRRCYHDGERRSYRWHMDQRQSKYCYGGCYNGHNRWCGHRHCYYHLYGQYRLYFHQSSICEPFANGYYRRIYRVCRKC